ncbi:MAG: DNA primase [Hyphomicrobiaceae bacterium]|nr:DNA primase [Hyphomicrobiaceae bacterium]
MRFSNAVLDQIRARVPVSDVVGRRVQWDRRKSRPQKGDFWACCPFHNEKTPSFHVDDRRGLYHCFGCGKTGDQFRFLCESENVSFPEAVEKLAREAGVILPARGTGDDEAARAERRMMDGFETAALYFQKLLTAPPGSATLAYAEGRGLDAETRKTFRIGYAPSRSEDLIAHLSAAGLTPQDMDAMGLVSQPADGGRPYARFRDRLIVPIADARGRIIGFGGRAVREGQEPKYLNSPETRFFDKGRLLYNAHRARAALAREETLIVVEGYLDAIALHRAGIEAVVASLGTAVTEDQIGLLWRLADEPVICFDGDEAGQRAAVRVLERALPMLVPGKSLRFVHLPDGKDPDDVVRAGGQEAFRAVLAREVPLVDALWTMLMQERAVDTPERLAALDKDVTETCNRIRDAAIRHNYLDALRMKLKALREALYRPAGQRDAPRMGAGGRAPVQAPRTEAVAETTLFGLCLAFPDVFAGEAERILSLDAVDPEVARGFAMLDGIVSQVPHDRALGSEAVVPALRARFGALVARAYGPQDKADALRVRHEVVAWNPPAAFIRRLMDHYVVSLELRAMERDHREAMDHALSEADMARANALSDALRAQRERLGAANLALEEELDLLRQTRAALPAERTD